MPKKEKVCLQDCSNNMADFIFEETSALLYFLAVGAAMAAVYDVFRILRKIIPHNYQALSAEDLVFWIAAGSVIFFLLLFKNNGMFRVYLFLGSILGALIYRETLSRLLVPGITFICEKVVEFCAKLLKKIRHLFKIKKKANGGVKSEKKKRKETLQ